MDVPKLDFSLFSNGSEQDKYSFAKDLVCSFNKFGFVRLTNHGISPKELAQAFEWSGRFFALPESVKRNLESSKIGPTRGFSYAGKERLWLFSENKTDIEGAKEVREHYDVGPFQDAQYPTPWPKESDIPGFKEYIESLYNRCQGISLQLIRAFELGTGIPRGAMHDLCCCPASDIRLNYYPAMNRQDTMQKNIKRIWPHTDTGLITLLFQEGFGGLQLEDRARPGVFEAVENDSPTDMIANTGESFQMWTNDQVLAGIHQVSLPTDRDIPERKSIAFFLRPHPDASVGSLPSFVSADSPRKYEDVSAQHYSVNTNGKYDPTRIADKS